MDLETRVQRLEERAEQRWYRHLSVADTIAIATVLVALIAAFLHVEWSSKENTAKLEAMAPRTRVEQVEVRVDRLESVLDRVQATVEETNANVSYVRGRLESMLGGS